GGFEPGPLSAPDTKKAPFRKLRGGRARGGFTRPFGPRPAGGLAVQTAARFVTAALRALPLRGDGSAVVSTRCAGGRTGGVRTRSPLSARYEKGPLSGAFGFRIWRREGDSTPRSAV